MLPRPLRISKRSKLLGTLVHSSILSYRTQVDLESDLCLSEYIEADANPADEDTNSIPTDETNRAFLGHLVTKFVDRSMHLALQVTMQLGTQQLTQQTKQAMQENIQETVCITSIPCENVKILQWRQMLKC